MQIRENDRRHLDSDMICQMSQALQAGDDPSTFRLLAVNHSANVEKRETAKVHRTLPTLYRDRAP